MFGDMFGIFVFFIAFQQTELVQSLRCYQSFSLYGQQTHYNNEIECSASVNNQCFLLEVQNNRFDEKLISCGCSPRSCSDWQKSLTTHYNRSHLTVCYRCNHSDNCNFYNYKFNRSLDLTELNQWTDASAANRTSYFLDAYVTGQMPQESTNELPLVHLIESKIATSQFNGILIAAMVCLSVLMIVINFLLKKTLH